MNEQEQPGMSAEEIDEIADLSSQFARMAHAHGGGALVFHPYQGPPPPPEFFLSMMRDMIDATGPRWDASPWAAGRTAPAPCR